MQNKEYEMIQITRAWTHTTIKQETREAFDHGACFVFACVTVCLHLEVFVQREEQQVKWVEQRRGSPYGGGYQCAVGFQSSGPLHLGEEEEKEEETYLETDKAGQAFLKLYGNYFNC